MQIKGTVKNTVFYNAENGYTVATLNVNGEDITVVGSLPALTNGEVVSCEGKFVVHQKFGQQFSVSSFKYETPDSPEGIVKYLSSGLIKGIGPITAKAIVDKFGRDTFKVIENDYLALSKVKGISKAKALTIYENCIGLKKMQNQIMALQNYGISTNLALKIYNVYKDGTEQVVSSNPYKLIDDVDGVGFSTADKIAESVGIEKNSLFRVRAGVVFTLKEAGEKAGNTFLYFDELKQKVAALLDLQEDITDKTESVIADMQLESAVGSMMLEGKRVISLSRYLSVEKSIAGRLVRMVYQPAECVDDVELFISEFERQNNFAFHADQKKAIMSAANKGVTVITGGPGTGKTTLVKCICKIFAAMRLKTELVAPTGRAAKRLSESTGYEAKTIHRLLGVESVGGKTQFRFKESNQLDCDAVIIDEMSMVDCLLFNSLLKALKPGCRLVLVGDKDQLPSVGAGNVLGDIISSGVFDINYLTYIYRQASDSLIVTNAHLINEGKMPVFDNKSKDFFFLPTVDAAHTAEEIVGLVTTRLPSFTHADPKDIQVLSPLKSGPAGVEKLNVLLQEKLNPKAKGKGELRIGETVFRLGDKVMQTQNNYEAEWVKISEKGFTEFGEGVFNGDIGYVTEVNQYEGFIEITFEDGRKVQYMHGDLSSLMLAYAITVHKSQGCEFDVAVIPLYGGSPTILNKNLLYTAITRAKKTVVLVGSKKYVAMMVKNNYVVLRNTLLKFFLNDENRKYQTFFAD